MCLHCDLLCLFNLPKIYKRLHSKLLSMADRFLLQFQLQLSVYSTVSIRIVRLSSCMIRKLGEKNE